jgi:hypothetical protein
VLQEKNGWGWFDPENTPSSTPTQNECSDETLPQIFAQTFRGPRGERVLSHLKSMTIERVNGPEASGATLRHLEGQRQLVSYILSLVKRGSVRPLIESGTKSETERLTEYYND